MTNIDVRNVLVVGEHTTPNGPFSDDHFLTIVMQDGQVKEISLGDAKAEELLTILERELGRDIDLGLSNRTDFASRVIYPETLKEKELYIFERKTSGLKGIIEYVRGFGIVTFEQSFTEDVKNYIKQR